MKKIVFMLIALALLASCNGGSDKTTNCVDSTKTYCDSLKNDSTSTTIVVPVESSTTVSK